MNRAKGGDFNGGLRLNSIGRPYGLSTRLNTGSKFCGLSTSLRCVFVEEL